jgi:membrane-associated phospholipid phosphatase
MASSSSSLLLFDIMKSLEHFFTTFITLLDYVAIFAPNILFILTIILVKSKSNLLFYYVSGSFINVLLNILLKLLFKQPRPKEDIKLVHLLHSNGERFGFDTYGMPSGHTQTTFFSLTYVYLSLQNLRIAVVYFALCLLTMYQRLKYKNHTFWQVIVGALVGVVFALFVYKMCQINIIGRVESKKDDDYVGMMAIFENGLMELELAL